jgi:hypothetical protein
MFLPILIDERLVRIFVDEGAPFAPQGSSLKTLPQSGKVGRDAENTSPEIRLADKDYSGEST